MPPLAPFTPAPACHRPLRLPATATSPLQDFHARESRPEIAPPQLPPSPPNPALPHLPSHLRVASTAHSLSFPAAPKSRHGRGLPHGTQILPLSRSAVSDCAFALVLPARNSPCTAAIVAASGVCLPVSCSSASPPPPSSVPQSPAHPHDANLCAAPPLPYRQLSSTSFLGHHPYLSHPDSCARGEGGGGS
jgi:hypothetical protein